MQQSRAELLSSHHLVVQYFGRLTIYLIWISELKMKRCDDLTWLWWMFGLLVLIVIIVGIVWASSVPSMPSSNSSPSNLFFSLGGQRPASGVNLVVPLKLVTSTGVTETLDVSNNSTFLFQHRFRQGESYTVTVDLVGGTCSVVNGQGTFSSGNISNLIVNCSQF